MWASRQDLNYKHATLVTDRALPERTAGEFFIAFAIILGGLRGRRFARPHAQQFLETTLEIYLFSENKIQDCDKVH